MIAVALISAFFGNSLQPPDLDVHLDFQCVSALMISYPEIARRYEAYDKTPAEVMSSPEVEEIICFKNYPNVTLSFGVKSPSLGGAFTVRVDIETQEVTEFMFMR